MYSISPHLVDNFSSNDSLNGLLKDVDRKIALMAVTEYNNVRLGLSSEVSLEQYKDLCIYKKILLDKLLGCNCLEDEILIMIVAKLKKLTK